MNHYKRVFSNVRRSARKRVSPATSEFFKDLKPLLAMMRALGVLPYHISPNGELCFKFLHPVTFYTVVVQAFITTIAVLRERLVLNKIDTDGVDFGRRMEEYSAFVFYMPCFLIPVTSWPETMCKLRFINAWARFQAEYTVVTGKPLGLQMGRRVRLAMVLAMTYVVVMMVLNAWRFRITSCWFLPGVMSCSFSVELLPTLWIVCCWQLKRAAFLLGQEMEHQTVLYGLEQGVRLSRYRYLWLRLSALTQDLGNSMTLTMGCFIIPHFALIVMFTYRMLLSIANGEGHRVFLMLFIVFFNLAIIYVCCSSAQTAVEQVDGSFRDHLEHMQIYFKNRSESAEYELEKFLDTIRRHKLVISFRGFAVIDRGLQTSFSSSLVTYMIVLVQFNAGEQGFSSTNSNCSR